MMHRQTGGLAWQLQTLWAVILVFAGEIAILESGQLAAAPFPQDETPSTQRDSVSEREREIAERFLGVVLRRPRPGTALDRVVDFHQRAGTIDELLERLSAQTLEGGDGAAASTSSDPKTGLKVMVGGLVQLCRGNAADAAARLRIAEDLLPNDAAVSYQLGRALLQIGEIEDAAKAITRATQRQPSRAEATEMFTTLAQIYSQAGDREKAIEVWNRLQEQFPDDSKIGGRIAEELARSGDAQEARRRFLLLAKRTRQSEPALRLAVRAAEMLRELGDGDGALRELDAALAKTRPGSWLYRDIRRRIEQGFIDAGDFAGLSDYYGKRIAANPDDLSMPLRFARLQINDGRLAEAQTLLETSIKRAPNSPDLKQALVDVLLAGGKNPQAAKWQREMIAADPDNADWVFGLARTLSTDTSVKKDDRYAAAVEVLTKYADRRSGDAVVLAQIADRLRALEASGEAIAIFRRAVQADPNSPQYREYLGEALFQAGQVDEAIAAW
ncbi:MAG: tetratricopeptide repeat protein [Planctomycetota bacterium]